MPRPPAADELELIDVSGDGVEHLEHVTSGDARRRGWIVGGALVVAALIAVMALSGGGDSTATTDPDTSTPTTAETTRQRPTTSRVPRTTTTRPPPTIEVEPPLPDGTGLRVVAATSRGVFLVDLDAGSAELIIRTSNMQIHAAGPESFVGWGDTGLEQVSFDGTGTVSDNEAGWNTRALAGPNGGWWHVDSDSARLVSGDGDELGEYPLPGPGVAAGSSGDDLYLQAGSSLYAWNPVAGSLDRLNFTMTTVWGNLAGDHTWYLDCDDLMQCTTVVVNARTGEERLRFPTTSSSVNVVLSPAGTAAVVLEYDPEGGGYRSVRLVTAEGEIDLSDQVLDYAAPSFSQDGQWLVAPTDLARVVLVNVDDGAQFEVNIDGSTVSSAAVVPSPVGSIVPADAPAAP
jgi:hypothetical protein